MPLAVDVETSGCEAHLHAILELAYAELPCDSSGAFHIGRIENYHLLPFPDAKFDPDSMAIHKIIPDYPLRFAETEEATLKTFVQTVQELLRKHKRRRAILVGHNAWFDLAFLNAGFKRCDIKSPFHRFTALDTATLAGFLLGQTVLPRALQAARISYDPREAHSALYDVEKTAALFCWLWARSTRISRHPAKPGNLPPHSSLDIAASAHDTSALP